MKGCADALGALESPETIDDLSMLLLDSSTAKDVYFTLNFLGSPQIEDDWEYERELEIHSERKAFDGASLSAKKLRTFALEMAKNEKLTDAAISLGAAAEVLTMLTPFCFVGDGKVPLAFDSLSSGPIRELQIISTGLTELRRDLNRAFAAMRLFGDLPENPRDRIARTLVLQKWKVSNSSITNWIKAGEFPKPINANAGRHTFWLDQVMTAMSGKGIGSGRQ